MKMKSIVIALLILTLVSQAQSQIAFPDSIHLPLSQDSTHLMGSWKGKRILVVNVSTSGTHANQLFLMDSLQRRFADSNLIVLACPSRDLETEFRSPQLVTLLLTDLGFQFRFSNTITVKGTGAHPFYQWLTHAELNGISNFEINSDFSKFLINSSGTIVGYFGPDIGPLDPPLLAAIRAAP